jgi:NCAIR mutase (PurE)-related protein
VLCTGRRTGLPEVIFSEGKTSSQVKNIFLAMETNQTTGIVMATRMKKEMFDEIGLENLKYFETARIASYTDPREVSRKPGKVLVMCAGTSDLPVAEEAAVTLELMGYHTKRIYDVGVAGIHRLLSHQDEVREAHVVICCAGMDGALPSVVGGLAEAPVIAVPTSVGYGAAFHGVAPLLTMLNSCSTGVGVVNIDNGFGAAMLAAHILNVGGRMKSPQT